MTEDEAFDNLINKRKNSPDTATANGYDPDAEFDKLVGYIPVEKADIPPEASGNLLTDIPKMAVRGLVQVPEALAAPVQAGASYLGKAVDTAVGTKEGEMGPVEANINYGLGKARDYTTRALEKGVADVLPYSAGTQEAQRKFGEDIQGITENKGLSIPEKALQAAGAAFTNPRGVMTSFGESMAPFLVGGGILNASKALKNVSDLKKVVALNALLEGKGGEQGAREDIANTPLETLRQSPRFAALEKAYGTENALKVAQEEAGSKAYLPTAIGGGLATAVTGGGGELRFLKNILGEGTEQIMKPGLKEAAKFLGKETLRSGLAEVPEETLQGITGQLGQNIGEQPYTQEDLTKGLAEQAGASGVGGLFGGLAFGGMGGARNTLRNVQENKAIAKIQPQQVSNYIDTDRAARIQELQNKGRDPNAIVNMDRRYARAAGVYDPADEQNPQQFAAKLQAYSDNYKVQTAAAEQAAQQEKEAKLAAQAAKLAEDKKAAKQAEEQQKIAKANELLDRHLAMSPDFSKSKITKQLAKALDYFGIPYANRPVPEVMQDFSDKLRPPTPEQILERKKQKLNASGPIGQAVANALNTGAADANTIPEVKAAIDNAAKVTGTPPVIPTEESIKVVEPLPEEDVWSVDALSKRPRKELDELARNIIPKLKGDERKTKKAAVEEARVIVAERENPTLPKITGAEDARKILGDKSEISQTGGVGEGGNDQSRENILGDGGQQKTATLGRDKTGGGQGNPQFKPSETSSEQKLTIFEVNGQNVDFNSLSDAQKQAWQEADADYESGMALANQKTISAQNRGKMAKAEGMKLSAKRRQITGLLTDKEQKKAAEDAKKIRPQSAVEHIEDGRRGIAVSAPNRGRVKVQFEDGSVQNIDYHQLRVAQEIPKADDQSTNATPQTAEGQPQVEVAQTPEVKIAEGHDQTLADAAKKQKANNEKTPEIVKQNGNAPKAETHYQDIPVALEQEPGSTRRGVDAKGNPWEVKMMDFYGELPFAEDPVTGEVKKTQGADKDHIDVFINKAIKKPEDQAKRSEVFIVDQLKDDPNNPGTQIFDEHKVIFGAKDADEAKKIYLRNYNKGQAPFGGIKGMPMAEFKAWMAGTETHLPLDKAIPVEEQPAATPTHIENGEAEAVTPKVISGAIETGAPKTPLSKTEMRKRLIAEIDAALTNADSFVERGYTELQPRKEHKRSGALAAKGREISNQGLTDLGYITFDVPGDGKFKVVNSKEHLGRFKKEVLASPGFRETRETSNTPRALPFSKSQLIADFLKDKEYENAYFAAQEAGERLGFGYSKDKDLGPVVYANVEAVEIVPQFKTFIGRTFDKDGKAIWRVIEEGTSSAIGNGATRAAAFADAQSKIEQTRKLAENKERYAEIKAQTASQEQLLEEFKKFYKIEEAGEGEAVEAEEIETAPAGKVKIPKSLEAHSKLPGREDSTKAEVIKNFVDSGFDFKVEYLTDYDALEKAQTKVSQIEKAVRDLSLGGYFPPRTYAVYEELAKQAEDGTLASLQQKIKDLDFKKPEYRVYIGKSVSYKISKIEYEYAQQLIAAEKNKVQYSIPNRQQDARLDELEPLFTDLLNLKTRGEAKQRIADHPLAERIAYVDANFVDLLAELENSGRMKYKC